MFPRLLCAFAALAIAPALLAGPTCLIVDDFETDFDWQSLWLGDLEPLGIAPEVIGSADATAERLAGADIVLWNCGNTAAPLASTEQRAVEAFLEGGGRLLIAAPGVPAQMAGGGEHGWLQGRLGCDYVMPDSSVTWGSVYRTQTVMGAEGSPLDGLDFSLTFDAEGGISARGMSIVHATDERARHLLRFRERPGFVAVARETPTDRTILMTVPLESIASADARGETLRRCVEWLSAPRAEGRGIWIVRDQLASPESIDAIVERCAEAGFNTLFVQVRGRGDAYYNSATEPRAEDLANQPLSFDPLQHCIDAGHARGLEVHAWMNAGYTWGPGDLPAAPEHIVNRHPEWVMVNRSGKSLMDYTREEVQASLSEGRYLSLAAPEVQDYLAGVYREVVENYDVDGVHFDFIRYCTRGQTPEWDLDYNPLTIAAFQEDHDFNPLEVEIDSEEYAVWVRWQQDRVGELVGRIREESHAIRPGIRVSAAVLSRYHLACEHSMQDWVAWLERGQLDTACLMSYSRDNDLVVQESLLAQENRGQGTIWVGMGAGHDIDLILDRIERVRRTVNPEGIMFFSYRGFDEADMAALRSGPFVDPAEVPEVRED